MPLAAALDQASVYTVSQLNATIKQLLESNYRYIWLKGEISNFRAPASGHFYFTLKDEASQIKAVLFRPQQRGLRFRLEDGLQVLCQGRVTVYTPRGDYQFLVERIEPQGLGAMQLAFEQLKQKLDREGLFAAERKLALPLVPQRLALVTSATGAAVRDIFKVLKRSPYPLTVTLLPVRVQGDEAAAEISAAFATINRLQDQYGWDLVIAGRGGGSLEDLWPFNQEPVARAMAASTVPVISAVGHEIDLTIADLVADLRMPTPTAAAEWVVTRLENVERTLGQQSEQLAARMRQVIERRRTILGYLGKRLLDPRKRLTDQRLLVDDRLERLERAMAVRIERIQTTVRHLQERLRMQHPRRRIERHQAELDLRHRQIDNLVRQRLTHLSLRLRHLAAQIQTLSPLNVLARGYAIATLEPERQVLRGTDPVTPGRAVRIQLHQGALDCTVDRVHPHFTLASRRSSPGGQEEEDRSI